MIAFASLSDVSSTPIKSEEDEAMKPEEKMEVDDENVWTGKHSNLAPLRWGIASAGRISNDFCAALSTLSSDDHQVVAVAARSLENARKFSETFGIPRFYEGYKQLAEDSEVDVVYIGAINPAHLEIGLMMLDAGKHILCEKPLTLNLKHTEILLQRAREKKLLCVEAIWSRFFPSYRHLKSRLDNNELGDIREVEVEFGFALEHVDRIAKKDLGVYTIQISQFVFRSEPISIRATGRLNDEGVDIETDVELTYPCGGVARFKTSALRELNNKAVVRGSKASMTLHSFWCSTVLTDIDESLKEWKLPKPCRGKFELHNSAGLRYEADEIRKCIIAGLLECEVVTHRESSAIARIQDEVRRQIGVKFAQD